MYDNGFYGRFLKGGGHTWVSSHCCGIFTSFFGINTNFTWLHKLVIRSALLICFFSMSNVMKTQYYYRHELIGMKCAFGCVFGVRWWFSSFHYKKEEIGQFLKFLLSMFSFVVLMDLFWFCLYTKSFSLSNIQGYILFCAIF